MNQKPENKTYIAIDLKSFYASVECADRGLDPLGVNLVVADTSRTDKTICLAVSPALKAYGIPGRARLFEVIRAVKEINSERLKRAPGGKFTGESIVAAQLDADPSLKLSFIAAKPRMRIYMEISSRIFEIYLKYVAPEDIHVYSVDEVFIDATGYLKLYGLTPREFTMKLIKEVLKETKITATAGIGTNLYLCKIAMDIVAKHIPPDEDGVRIAQLDEMSYREILWSHTPITDFWRVGHGYARKLAASGMYTMGDVARCSVYNEERLYKMFGVNAELLIDHAWGWEPATIADIKSYRPENNSISSGQVLSRPYRFAEARIIVREMTDLLVLDMVDKKLVADQMVLTVCYDSESLSGNSKEKYSGPVEFDRYGRAVPKNAHGSINLGSFTSSGMIISEAVMKLFDSITDEKLTVRRIYVVANHVIRETDIPKETEEQLDMFSLAKAESSAPKEPEGERAQQETVIAIRKKFGKNAIIKGMDLQEGATAIERNRQVGGHKA